MRGLEHAVLVADVGPRRHAQAAHLGRAGVREVVAVEIRSGEHLVFVGPQEHLLKHRVGDAVFDENLAGRERSREVFLGDAEVRELIPGDLVAPVAESALGELHDVALVHQRDAAMAVLQGVENGAPHQPLGAENAHGLDPDAGVGPDLLAHLVAEEIDHLLGFGRALAPFDARVDVLGVLAHDDHVEPLGVFDRRGDPGVVANRTPADVEVEQLPQCDVQAADAATDRRGQRALDGDVVLADGVEGGLGQPVVGSFVSLLPREHLEPGDRPLATVGPLHRGVENRARRFPDVRARAIALNVRNDGVIRRQELAGLNLNRLTVHSSLP